MRWNANQLAKREARQFAVLAHAPDFLGAATPAIRQGLRAIRALNLDARH
jgi:hypothetical protein